MGPDDSTLQRKVDELKIAAEDQWFWIFLIGFAFGMMFDFINIQIVNGVYLKPIDPIIAYVILKKWFNDSIVLRPKTEFMEA